MKKEQINLQTARQEGILDLRDFWGKYKLPKGLLFVRGQLPDHDDSLRKYGQVVYGNLLTRFAFAVESGNSKNQKQLLDQMWCRERDRAQVLGTRVISHNQLRIELLHIVELEKSHTDNRKRSSCLNKTQYSSRASISL